jgi:N utilization substance protein A
MASPLRTAIEQICEEKNIPFETVVESIEAALAAAYRKDFGQLNQNVKVQFDPDTGSMKAWDVKVVMEKPIEETIELSEVSLASRDLAKPDKTSEINRAEPSSPSSLTSPGLPTELEAPKFNPKFHFTPEEARVHKPDAAIGDEIRIPLEIPGEFGRMAAQTAKQVIQQKIREAEREAVYEEFKDKVGSILNVIIGRREGRNVIVEIGKATAILPYEEQIERERYQPGIRMKVFVAEVRPEARGPAIVVSRVRPEMVALLFDAEIPEVHNKMIEIVAIAREAGSRTKVAVKSLAPNIDPIGSCVGQRGARIQTVIQELGGEKIDIIQWDPDPARYIGFSLSPAKVRSVELMGEEHRAIVKVNEDQLSLAIGRGGQNVRLAARLTGWKIDISGAEKVMEEEPAVGEPPVETEPEEKNSKS